MDSGKPLFPPLKGHESGGGSLVFSSDGKTLVSWSADLTMRWWSVATGQEMLLFQNVMWVNSSGNDMWAERNPDGKILLWDERPRSIRVATLPTLAEIDTKEKRTEGKTW